MISSLHKFVGICLLTIYPLAGLASPQTVDNDTHSIKAQLKASVHKGMTIDEAVAQSVTAAPHNGGKITKIALSIYKRLPQTACAMRAKDGGMRLAVWPDFRACGDRIVRAAIKSGADPTEITSASATGPQKANQVAHSPNQTSGKSARKTFGIDMYVLRQIFLGSAY